MNNGNSFANYYSWENTYPDLQFLDLETGVVQTLETRLESDGTDDCESCNRVISDIHYQEITTGSTWPGFKVYMDPTQVEQEGYEFGSLDGSPVITGYTFFNFVQSPIPPLYFVQRIQHYSDGTTVQNQTAWSSTGLPNSSLFWSLLGNAPAPFSLQINQIQVLYLLLSYLYYLFLFILPAGMAVLPAHTNQLMVILLSNHIEGIYIVLSPEQILPILHYNLV